MTIYSKTNPPLGFYVYAYLRVDGTPYYIGKGSRTRAWSKGKNEVTKPPVDPTRIIILLSSLTESEAFLVEHTEISKFGRKDLGTGILRNRTDGGQGPTGRPCSTETRAKRSEYWKGRPKTAEQKEKARIAQLGKKLTAETRAKMSATRQGVKQPIVTCPCCSKEGGAYMMKRHHFDNCRTR